MQKKHLLLAVLFTLISCITQQIKAQTVKSPVVVTQTSQSVTIGNDYLQRDFSIQNGKLTTAKIINKRTDGAATNFVPAIGSEEFQVKIIPIIPEPDLGKLDRSTWTITATSWTTQEPIATNGPPTALIDGNENSFWHTNFGTGVGGQDMPHSFTIDLKEQKTFQCFSYLCRQDGAANGMIKNYEFYAVANEADFATATSIKSGTFTYDGQKNIYVNLPTATTARYVRLKVISSTNGQKFASGAEFALYTGKHIQPETNNNPKINKTAWTIEANSWSTNESAPNGPASNLIDGNINTHWHSNYGTAQGTGPTSYPYYVIIDLKATTKFNAFSYTPRITGPETNGNILGYEIYVGNTRDEVLNATVAARKGSFIYNDVKPIYVNLPSEANARFVKLVATSAVNGQQYGGGAEFDLHADRVVEPIETKIKTTDLTLASTVVNDLTDGKEIIFTFAPYLFEGATWNIKEVVTMKDGDHFMRKQIKVALPSAQRALAKIDYIDCESLITNDSDVTWSHPSMGGGVGGMSGYLIANGQPIYIQAMFFGSEFPVTDNAIADKVASIRYFSGKTFEVLNTENRLDNDGYFSTWNTVAGAARSTDMEVMRTDLFEYINTIATPTKMRTQYNSWYDWMMNIDENNIMSSFKEMERGLSQNGSAPMDAFVVDDGWNAYGDWEASNTTGGWQFNHKFPNGLTPPMSLAHKYASTFGLWLGPAGGYNWPAKFANFLQTKGTGELNTATGSVCTSHKIYLDKLLEFFLDCQEKYTISYWKLDGFATQACPKVHEHHITGGSNGMYWMTEHWERWTSMLTTMREHSKATGQDDLWINLTCYVNPSPWYLQWSNSVWMQNSLDMGRVNTGLTSQVDQLLTYRDGRYNNFSRERQFQFPYANIYNHDPIYGKTGSNLAGTMNDDEFRAYLFMVATRGAALWNLYFSFNMIDEGTKWAVTSDALDWKKKNFNTIRNAKMFGGNPESGDVYGYSAWNGTDGIIAIRNPKNSAQSYTITLDRNIGVTEGVTNLHRVSVLNFRTPTINKDNNTNTFNYGQVITIQLQPGESRIWQFAQDKDTKPAAIQFVKATSLTQLLITFDEHVNVSTAEFKINGTTVSGTPLLRGDRRTVQLTVPIMMKETEYTLSVDKIVDFSDNTTTQNFSFKYYPSMQIVKASDAEHFEGENKVFSLDKRHQANMLEIKNKEIKIVTDNKVEGVSDFGISFLLNSTGTGKLLSQGDQYSASINAQGKLSFNVKSDVVTSDSIVNDGKTRHIYLCRERNGMLKIYINGQVEKSIYDETKLNQNIATADLTVGSSTTNAKIGNINLYNKAHSYSEIGTQYNALSTYYTITVNTSTGGATNVTNGEVAVLKGAGHIVTFTPNSGYRVKEITLNGVSLGAIASYTFSNVQKDHTLEVEFELSTGIEETIQKVTLFPTQAINQITLRGAVGSEMKIINAIGNVIETRQVTQQDETINCSTLSQGVYFVRIKLEGIERTYRFIKK